MLIIFFLTFIVLCSSCSWQILLVGAVLALAIYLFSCRFLGYSVRGELRVLRKIWYVLGYACLLFYEIVLANFTLLRMILSPRFEPKPLLVTFTVPLQSDYARVMLANSITLTPGTITVEVEGDTYTVHCLDESLAEGITDSKFVHMLKKLEA